MCLSSFSKLSQRSGPSKVYVDAFCQTEWRIKVLSSSDDGDHSDNDNGNDDGNLLDDATYDTEQTADNHKDVMSMTAPPSPSPPHPANATNTTSEDVVDIPSVSSAFTSFSPASSVVPSSSIPLTSLSSMDDQQLLDEDEPMGWVNDANVRKDNRWLGWIYVCI